MAICTWNGSQCVQQCEPPKEVDGELVCGPSCKLDGEKCMTWWGTAWKDVRQIMSPICYAKAGRNPDDWDECQNEEWTWREHSPRENPELFPELGAKPRENKTQRI